MKLVNLIIIIWITLWGLLNINKPSLDHEIQNPDKTINIGLLIQDNESVEAKYAAELAVRKVNAKGGINGRLVKLIVRSMDGPWGTGSKQAVDMIFNEKVCAIMGSHDGRNAHLVEQTATKAQTVFLSAWASDPTLSQAFVPWLFNFVPNDNQQADALIEEIYNKRKIAKVALLSDNGYDAKKASEAFIKKTKKLQKSEPIQLYYHNSKKDFNNLLDQIIKAKVECVVLLGQPAASLEIIRLIKQKNVQLPVFGGLSILGENSGFNQDLKKYENVVFISIGNYLEKKRIDFQNEYKNEKNKTPGTVAVYAYDCMNLLLEAIRKTGFEREKIQKTLLNMRYEGITGPVQFDSKGNRLAKAGLMEIKNGIPIALKK